MKPMRILFATALLLAFAVSPAVANYIQINNVSIVERNDEDKYAIIQFDLSWQNSWRTNIGDATRDNWDAAWVFIKWIKTSDRPAAGQAPTVAWSHGMLAAGDHTIPSGFTHDLGRPDENSAYNSETNPYVGAFIYRDENNKGAGDVTIEGVRLKWDYAYSGLEPTDQVDIKVFGIEMVFVPEGPFWVGCGGVMWGSSFTDGSWSGSWDEDPSIPFKITENWDREFANQAGKLWHVPGHSSTGNIAAGSLPDNYPTGYEAFYLMKHNVTQGAWIDFLNTLTAEQANNHFNSTTSGRHSLYMVNNKYQTNHHFLPKNMLAPLNQMAYYAWSGLRPYTELEYEKAGRGPLYPVPNEFAWGTADASTSNYTIASAGAYNERVTSNYDQAEGVGNMIWWGSTSSVGRRILRVGIFATDNSNRVLSGASYWGILNLSGIPTERPVSVHTTAGMRNFTGIHGDGSLTNNGWASVENWPSGLTRRGGGGYSHNYPHGYYRARLSSRERSSQSITWVSANFGSRGGRTAPSNN